VPEVLGFRFLLDGVRIELSGTLAQHHFILNRPTCEFSHFARPVSISSFEDERMCLARLHGRVRQASAGAHEYCTGRTIGCSAGLIDRKLAAQGTLDPIAGPDAATGSRDTEELIG